MPAGPLSPLPSLLAWAAGSIGPRVARLLLAQLLLLTLVAGVNSRLFAQLVPALRADADLRTATLASIAIAVAASRHPLRHALCPPSLAALRRQPLGTASFALLALPWAAPLAWSWALVPALGHLDARLSRSPRGCSARSPSAAWPRRRRGARSRPGRSCRSR